MRDALRHVLFYESGDLSLAAEHFPAHQARYAAVFTTHEAAMDFASGDPFVEHGVVSAWQVR